MHITFLFFHASFPKFAGPHPIFSPNVADPCTIFPKFNAPGPSFKLVGKSLPSQKIILIPARNIQYGSGKRTNFFFHFADQFYNPRFSAEWFGVNHSE